MGVHQWIELSSFLVGLQDYTLEEIKKEDLTPDKFKELYQNGLHSILMGKIYQQLLVKSKNCHE